MLVIPVSSRRDVRRFVALPYRLHREVPQWVPPLRRDVARFFDRSHPFYVHSEAAFFAAERDGEVVARVGVHEDTVYNRVRGRRWAFFHLFEASDRESGQAVLETAAGWAMRRGLDRLVGPIGFLPGDGMGILVDGFQHPSPMPLQWHPPQYGEWLQSFGLTKETDFLSGRVKRPFEMPDALFEIADAAIAEHGFTIKTFRTRRELRRWIHHIGEVYNQAFVDNWEYRPVEPGEMRAVADVFLPIADPRLILLLMHGEDSVGFFFILPDVGEGLKKAAGRLLPLGWWHILRSTRRTGLVDFLGLGVVPQFQSNGANMAIYCAVARKALDFPRYRAAELIQVEEGNTRMQRNIAALGISWNRRHRVYGRALRDR